MKKQRKTTHQAFYHEHPINTGLDRTPCDKRILNSTERVAQNTLKEHSRILACPFVVKFPDDYIPDDNEEVKTAMARTVKECQRGKPSHKPTYVLVKERSRDGGIHYHGMLFLDNSVVRSPVGTLKKLERNLERAVGIEGRNGTNNQGLVELCNTGKDGKKQKWLYIIHRGNKEEFDDMFYRASYMAKLKDKDDNGRELFCSKTMKSQGDQS